MHVNSQETIRFVDECSRLVEYSRESIVGRWIMPDEIIAENVEEFTVMQYKGGEKIVILDESGVVKVVGSIGYLKL